MKQTSSQLYRRPTHLAGQFLAIPTTTFAFLRLFEPRAKKGGMRVINLLCILLLITFCRSGSAQTLPSSSAKTVSTTINVRVNGAGTVKPDYNGKLLKIGKAIHLKVKPAPGYIFAGWTDNLQTDTTYNDGFTVESGLDLVANFILNPFPAVQGEYDGLISDTNGDHTGLLSLHLNDKGKYSGKIIVDGRKYSLGFNAITADDTVTADGHVQEWLFRGNDDYGGSFHQVLTVDFQFDLTNGTDLVIGTVSDAHMESRKVGGVKDWYWVPATWVAELAGSRAN